MAKIMSIATVLAPHLYNAKDMWDFVNLRVTELQNSGDPQDALQAQALIGYQNFTTNTMLREFFDSIINSLYSGLDDRFDNNFSLFSRWKSVVRFMEKAETLAEENRVKPAEKRLADPFANMTDQLAFRCVVDGSIDTLYEFGNFMIDFFWKKYQVLPVLAKPLRDIKSYKTSEGSDYNKILIGEDSRFFYYRCIPKNIDMKAPDFEIRRFSIVTIPKKSGLKAMYRKYFKDYVSCPKDNLYQSLHCVYRLPGSNLQFEVQLRTNEMDAYADHSFVANHGRMRELQNQKIPHEDIDFSRVTMDGIVITWEPENPYKDNHYFFDAFVTTQRTKTMSHSKESIQTP